MLLQQLNRSDAEKVFIIVMNASGVTVTQGALACFDARTTNSLGNAVMQPITSNLAAFAGCFDADLAADAFGLVQVYGYRASVAVRPAGLNEAVITASGIQLGPITGAWSAQSQLLGPIGSFHGPIVLLDPAVSNLGWAKGFIRAL